MYCMRHGLQRWSIARSARPEIGLHEAPARGFLAERLEDPRERHALNLAARPVAHGVGAGLELLIAHHERVRHLHELRRPDLLADALLRVVDLGAQPGGPRLGRELATAVRVAIGDRHEA